MKKLFPLTGLFLLSPVGSALTAEAPGQAPTVVIYDGRVTELRAPSPFTQSKDLWVTLTDLKRATGFVVKPQGVCRDELCFPLPRQRKRDFLVRRGKSTWFNLSAFARLVNQPVARDEKLAAWCFGTRADAQDGYLTTLAAPDFTLPDPAGKLHSLSDFRGKKVLLITWASW